MKDIGQSTLTSLKVNKFKQKLLMVKNKSKNEEGNETNKTKDRLSRSLLQKTDDRVNEQQLNIFHMSNNFSE